MTQTPQDIVNAVQTAFPKSDTSTILDILDLYGTEPYEREINRVKLAIITLSEGSEDKLLYFLQIAKTDYRDVLCWVDMKPLTAAEGEQQQQAVRQLIAMWGKK
ncbi:MAG: hypothetical protein KGO49_06265 [Gammaproteobacteria bacterium]|nr:hypothetical protein [Gammaproteobacteria bacterium]